MPVMDLLLKRLAGKVYFATIDLRMGYHQWEVEEASIPFTAFITQSGTFWLQERTKWIPTKDERNLICS
jgi:hypothetical protein